MPRLVKMNVSEELEVNVLVPESLQPGAVDVAAPRKIEKGLFEALDFVSAFARSAGERLRQIREVVGPDELGLEFGILVGAQAGIVLTSANVEGQISVTMTWKRAP